MSDWAAIERGHTEVHVMAETGRTIQVRCLCREDRDHPYRPSEVAGQRRRRERLR